MGYSRSREVQSIDKNVLYKDAGAAILVYDITREVSFEELKNYILQYKGTTKEFITTCYIYYFVDII